MNLYIGPRLRSDRAPLREFRAHQSSHSLGLNFCERLKFLISEKFSPKISKFPSEILIRLASSLSMQLRPRIRSAWSLAFGSASSDHRMSENLGQISFHENFAQPSHSLGLCRAYGSAISIFLDFFGFFFRFFPIFFGFLSLFADFWGRDRGRFFVGSLDFKT